MNVLLLFTYGVSLEDWNKVGLISREISLYKKLIEKKISFKFITFGKSEDKRFSDLLGNIEIIPVLKLIKSKFPKVHFLKSLILPLKLKNTFKEVDIIKTNQIQGSWIACIAKILFKRKIIIRGGYEKLIRHIILSNKRGVRNYLKYLMNYFLIFINELISYKLADGIILTNNQDVSFIIKCFKLKRKFKDEKIRCFSNYIDIELFQPLNIKKKENHILYIGGLKKQKNLYNLLQVFSGSNEFYLDIIGTGPIELELKEKTKKLGLNVNFLGIFPNKEIPKIMNQYNILILPSYWEGNPKVLLEAMSCGIACIGSNIPGINDIIKHRQNGYLCRTSPKSIKQAIITLYKNSSLREEIGENARAYVVNNCSLNSIAQQEFLFYKQILKK